MNKDFFNIDEDIEQLPEITSYLDRLSEEVLAELSNGKGDDEDGVQ